MQSIPVFLDVNKFADFRWKDARVSRYQAMCHVFFGSFFMSFLDLLKVRHNCAKFDHCRICLKDFRERGLFAPHPTPIREQPQKCPSWIWLRPKLVNSPFLSYSFTNRDFLISHSAHLDCITSLPYLVLKMFEFSVFFLHFTQ